MFVELNKDNFKNEIKDGLKLVDFYTTWCKFCKNQDVVLEDLSENKFWIGKVDCDKESEIAEEYGVTGFPTMLLFKEGKKVAQIVGYHEKSALLDKLMNYL